MGDEGPSGQRPQATTSSDRLDSWKEIAAYLGKGVTTIQRWERHEGLPVHRHLHATKGSVFAFRSEVDEWRTKRSEVASEAIETSEQRQRAAPAGAVRRANLRPALLALTVLVAIGGLALASLTGGRSGTPPVSRDVLAVRPLAVDAEGEFHPSLSPDGREVVYNYWSPPHALMIRPTAGGPARPLTRTPPEQFDGSPTWSPRGDAIAFLRQYGWDRARRDLFVISPLDGTQRRLTSAIGVGLAWTPDGRSIAFVDSDSAGEPHAIFLLSVETGQRRRLTSPPLGTFGDLYCAFSPDGRTLAFSRWPSTVAGDIWIMPSTGGEARQLTRSALAQEGLDWTPDGKSIVFASRRGGLLGLWAIRVTADGSEAPTLVAGTSGAKFPSFSRSHERERAKLAYEYEVRDANVWRWRAASGGEGAFDRVVASTWYDDNPSFSPDGQRLLFTSNRTGHNEVWTANADGTSPTRLTQREGPLVGEPRYSPDGRSVAFVSSVGDNQDIFVANADGSGSRRLTAEPSVEGAPSWSHDGRWVYFRSNRGGVAQIWKAPAAGGAAVRVTRGEGWQAFEAPGGKTLCFVRNRELPGVWSVAVDGGPETLVVPEVRESLWGVANSGIFFLVDRAAWNIAFFDFKSRTTSDLTSLPGNKEILGGFDVSPDGRSVLWTQRDTSINDIMLIDDWPFERGDGARTATAGLFQR